MIFKGKYDKTLLEGELADFPGPVRLQKVNEAPREALWNHLVREYHYLGSENISGAGSNTWSPLVTGWSGP
ncbi:MAG: hypothetical protein LBF22_00070 [Deltaproteobacteria bacterium]|nr:hypothetical protein [Deltaproteobacteria bacterium]